MAAAAVMVVVVAAVVVVVTTTTTTTTTTRGLCKRHTPRNLLGKMSSEPTRINAL